MATPAAPSGHTGQHAGRVPRGSQRSRLVRATAITLIAVIILLGLAILVTWLAIRPKILRYTIEDAKVHGFDLQNNHLNASFEFKFQVYNPNHRISIYYDSIQVLVSFGEQTIAFDVVEPFYQRRRNLSRFEAKPVARAVPLLDSVARDLKEEKSSGAIDLVVQVKGKIRFKVGLWKSDHYGLRVFCLPTVATWNSSKSFEKTNCNVDI